MATIPKPREMPTMAAMLVAIEAAQDSTQRPYLGASQLGHGCARSLWYGFRWAAARRMSASSILAIEDGFAGEAAMAKRLRKVPGLTLCTENLDGQQFGVEAVSGHVRGHLDGGALGVVEAPKTWHVWEHKQVNVDKFRKLAKLVEQHGEKAALEQWDEVYFGQAQIYMGLTGMDRHFLTVGSPGGRDYISVRTEFDRKIFEALMSKAEKIVKATEPPLRLSDDPDLFVCRWCAFSGICHGTDTPAVNCRTCVHSTPVITSEGGGRWRCDRDSSMLTTEAQRAGCDHHLYIPPLLRSLGSPIDADESSVTYAAADGRTWANGPRPGFASIEIHRLQDKRALTDPTVREALGTFETAQVTA